MSSGNRGEVVTRYGCIAVTVLLATLLGGAVAVAQAPTTLEPLVLNWRDADWGPPTNNPGFPQGLRNAPIAVDPETGGPTYLARFPAGSRFAMHWHTYTETLMVLEGAVQVTIDGREYTATAGSYVILPARAHHAYVVPEDADVVLLARRDGPADFHFVD